MCQIKRRRAGTSHPTSQQTNFNVKLAQSADWVKPLSRSGDLLRKATLQQIKRQLAALTPHLLTQRHDEGAARVQFFTDARAQVAGWSKAECDCVFLGLSKSFQSRVINEVRGLSELLNEGSKAA